MRKLFGLGTLFLACGIASAAPITDQWIAPGSGISGSSKIFGTGSSLNGKTMLDLMDQVDANRAAALAAQATASDAIPKTGNMDSSGNITAPILSGNATFGTRYQMSYPTVYIGQDMTSVLGSPLVGNETVQIGGSPLGVVADSPEGSPGLPQSLVVSSHPDGPYNNGCGLCIFTTGGQQNTMLAELGGDDYEGQNRIVPAGFDTAGIYWEAGSRQARLVLPVTAYTDTTATLSTTLTAQQLLLIHQGQYIVTNSVDPDATGTESWSSPHFLAGVVRSVDNTGSTAVITVWAWNSLGQSGTSKTPSLTSLDTFYFPQTSAPTVFVGAPTKAFGFNTMMRYDGSFTGAGTADSSAVHQLEWGEVDVNVQNETRAHSLSYHGLTFGGNQTLPSGATIAASDVFTDDSYEMLLANSMPHHLEIADACGNMAIETNQLYLPSACSLFTLTPVSSVYDFDMTELHQIVAGFNERLVTHITSDGKGTGSYTNATLRFGPRINGTMGNTSSNDTSSLLGEIDFPGANGGVNLCGYGVNCGFNMDGNGNVSLLQALTVAGGTTLTNQLSVKANMTITGTTYYQNTAGDNIVAAAASTDSTGANTLAYSSLASGGASVLFNLPTTVGNNLTITGGLTSHGNTVLGGYGGSIALKDSVTVSGALTANGDVVATQLTGTGNAFACLDSTGKLYRSSTACN